YVGQRFPPDPECSERCRELLNELYPPTHQRGFGTLALEPLIRALDDPYAFTAIAAANGLTKLGREALPALKPLERVARQSPSWGVRSQALDALKAIGPEGLPTIVTAIHDPDKNVRDYAIKLLASYGKPGVPALIAYLNEPWNASSERALDALDSLGR